MPMEKNEEIHVIYKEPNARRDIMALIKRRKYNLIKDEENLLIISK